MRIYLSKLLILVVPASLIMALVAPAAASDLTNAQYYGTIIVSNNSTATANVSTTMTLSSADLISQGWVDSNFNNIAMRNGAGADVPFMPSANSSYPWALWVPSIGSNASQNYILYTGNGSLSSTKYYFPGSSGMRAPNTASMAISTNGSMQLSAFYDSTQVGKVVIDNPGSFSENFTSSGNLTACIWGTPVSQTAYDSEAPLNNVDWIRVGQRITTFPASTILGCSFYLKKVGSPLGTANITVRRVSDDVKIGTIGTLDVSTLTTSYGWYDFNTTLVPNLAAQNLRVQIEYTSGNSTNYVYVGYKGSDVLAGSYVTAYNPAGSYTDTATMDCAIKWSYGLLLAASINSGEQSIATTFDSSNMTIYKDGVYQSSVALGAFSIPSGGNLQVGSGEATPYINTWKVYVGGNLKQSFTGWAPGTTFADASGNSNTMTPSFRTTSSNAYVSAALSSFEPISLARAPAYTITGASPFITANITVSGNFTAGAVPAAGPPGSDVIQKAAEAGETPNIWLWGILGAITIAFIGLFISWMERKYGGGAGTLLLRMGAALTVMGMLVAFHKFDFWMIVLYVVIAGAPAMASRHTEWGGNLSQLNLIGFLSSSWIGLTIINRIMEGQFITGAETIWANYYAFTQEFKLFNLFSMPVLNLQFFTHGIPSLIKWDYSFFGGNAQMIQYLLYSLTSVVSLVIFSIVIGLLYSAFNRVR